MIKKTVTLLCVMVAVCLGLACSHATANAAKNTTSVEKTVKIGNFSKVKASTGIAIVFTQAANSGYAEIKTTTSAAPYIDVYVEKDCLVARYKNHGNKNIQGPTIVTVSSKKLTYINLSSSASFKTQNINQSAKISVDISSAASVGISNLICPKLEVDMSSSASINIGNLDGELDIDGSSASSALINQLKGSEAEIDLSSASTTEISLLSSTTLDVETSSGAGFTAKNINCNSVSAYASSGSRITLRGSAESINDHSSSGAHINITKVPAEKKKTVIIKNSKSKSGQLRTP